jgi:hypothetical protein
MRGQIEPSWSDGLFAAGAFWVGGHCSPFPGLTISGIILRVFAVDAPSFSNIAAAAGPGAARLRISSLPQ